MPAWQCDRYRSIEDRYPGRSVRVCRSTGIPSTPDARAPSPSARDRREPGRQHQVVLLRNHVTRLVVEAQVILPFRIRRHGGALAGAVGNVIIEPHVNQGIHLTRLGEQVGERLTEMTRLRLEAGLFIKLEMGRNHSGLDPIVSMVDQHAFLHGLGATAAPSRSCEPGEFGVNSPSIAWKRGRLAAPTLPRKRGRTRPASFRWVRITGTSI